MEVGQLSDLGARVAAMVLSALLPIGVKAGDTIRLCHGAGGGAPWHVPTAVRSGEWALRPGGPTPNLGNQIPQTVSDAKRQ